MSEQTEKPEKIKKIKPFSLEDSAEKIGKNLLQSLIDHYKGIPKTWQEMSKDEQQAFIDRTAQTVKETTRKMARIIYGADYTTIIAKLDKYTNDGEIKANIVVSAANTEESLNEFFRSAKQMVHIVLADPEQYLGAMEAVKPEKKAA